MTRKKQSNNDELLDMYSVDAVCRMRGAGLLPPPPSLTPGYGSTSWVNHNGMLYEYNKNGYTGNVAAAK